MDTSEKRRILVVEPDPAIRALVAALLQREGYTADTASNADAALQMRRKSEHGAVVVEPRMPGGEMLLAALRTDAELGTNVIIITSPDWREPVYVHDDGIRGVLHKPFYLHDLAELVASCFHDGGNRGAGTDRSVCPTRLTP